ncbi:2Fe-2S iron-sulfur cluster binding domain-containing protein, partial [Mesorhizobium sp. M2A.F.Ca.ET.046.02.1.1]
MLEAAGFDMSRYHQESFAAPAVEEVPAPFAMPAGDEAKPLAEAVTPVRFSLSNVDAECVPGQTVLQTARASGVRIPAACEFGLCGTCKVKKVSGEVSMSHNGGILDHEIDDGYILACCSRPLSALDIEA